MLKDKGAHFHKCDFQVHTPRDSNWEGEFSRVVTEDERKAFASALIAACRNKGLDAIAITDHHDLCMWKYVRDAARSERREEGQSVDRESQISIFPGMELSFSNPPCQGLVLFDPELPFTEAFVNSLKGALRIAPFSDSEAKCGPIQKLATDLDFNGVITALSDLVINPEITDSAQRQKLGGRFIILPHVRRSGYKTVTRMGFDTIYTKMPFVGGYIEGRAYEELDEGNLCIVEGRDELWGRKSLGIFQTSDSRKASIVDIAGRRVIDFPSLGAWPTWVKWVQPSAEAIRQSCLARVSRISHIEPVLPTHQILGIEITGSKFLGAMTLALNPQFNAFIGGRGTGKTTLLEYIRWALCDDPQAFDESIVSAPELPNFQRRRRDLIENTLKPFSSKVTVYYRKNNVEYKLERSTAERSESIQVTGPDGSTQSMAGDQVRREFPVVSYAQKQLSSVGTLPEEVKRIITGPIKSKLDEINELILLVILPKLKEQRSRERRIAQLDARVDELQVSIKVKREQVKSLEGGLTAATPEQREVIQSHEALANQDQWIKVLQDRPIQMHRFLSEVKGRISAISDVVVRDDFPMKADLENVARAMNRLKKDIIDALQSLIQRTSSADPLGEDIARVIKQVVAIYATHCAQYDAYIKDTARTQQQMNEIQSLNEQIVRDEVALTAVSDEKNTLSCPMEGDLSPWDQWLNAHAERARLLGEQCRRINELAQYSFRAELRPCGDPKGLIECLEKLIEGRRVRDADFKIRQLAREVTGASEPLQKWALIVREIEELQKSKGASGLPTTPILSAAGFTFENLDSIRNREDIQDLVEEIRYSPIEDCIEFQYTFGRTASGADNYIPFHEASPGQQATCLLKTLFAESGTPLLIDQPEDDLDNEQIHALSERICETKHNRQMIFVSHNANIVVNGDAELVACFSYLDPHDRTKGKIERVGSIDCAQIRDAITSVMEGGKKAFELRRLKYGF